MTPARILLIAAAVCFAIGLLVAVGALDSTHADAWLFGGLLSWALAHCV